MLDLWFDPERFELGCQPFGALAFLLSLLAFLLSALAFPLYRGRDPDTMRVVKA